MRLRVRRLPHNPMIRPGMDERMGANINGPSLIRVPSWLEGALGRYYLYFADHRGSYIRMAFADTVGGPWPVCPPGTLQLEQSLFPSKKSDLAPRDEPWRSAGYLGWKEADDYFGECNVFWGFFVRNLKSLAEKGEPLPR